MLISNFSELSADHINKLVDDSVEESRTLEFKRDLPDFSKNEEKYEFLEDVVSFANSDGGQIIFGIEEAKDENGKRNGIAGKIVPLKNEVVDATILRIESLLRDSIETRIDVKVKSIKVNDGVCLVINILKSLNPPHRVIPTRTFVCRGSNGKYRMDIGQIRSMILGSAIWRKELEEFRNERLFKIKTGRADPRILLDRLLIMHFLPFKSFAEGKYSLSIESIKSRVDSVGPMTSEGYASRYNFEGIFQYCSDNSDQSILSYNQFFQNGVVESVDAFILSEWDSDSGVYAAQVEQAMIRHVERIVKFMKDVGISEPIYLFVSMVGLRGRHLIPWRNGIVRGRNSTKFDRNDLDFRDVCIDEFSKPVTTVLQPIFDQLHQAAGFPKCNHIQVDGTWKET